MSQLPRGRARGRGRRPEPLQEVAPGRPNNQREPAQEQAQQNGNNSVSVTGRKIYPTQIRNDAHVSGSTEKMRHPGVQDSGQPISVIGHDKRQEPLQEVILGRQNNQREPVDGQAQQNGNDADKITMQDIYPIQFKNEACANGATKGMRELSLQNNNQPIRAIGRGRRQKPLQEGAPGKPNNQREPVYGEQLGNMDTTHANTVSVISKKGTSGEHITLSANYFKFILQSDCSLYQYRVDFAEEIESTKIRKKIFRSHANSLGAYIFDGSVLYSKNLLVPENDVKTLVSHWNDTQVVIKIRLVKDIVLEKDTTSMLQVFNIVMRRCLDILNLQLVGRNYYDPEAAINIPKYKLSLWPGYLTSIRRHENSFLLCADIIHKVIRTDTVLDKLIECTKHDPEHFKENFKKEVIGRIVITYYNNRNYQIDDVDFTKNPDSKFDCGERSISYRDYFCERYQINIRETQQPLLISRLKRREVLAGGPPVVCLIPELCKATGFTDYMRNDFPLMCEVSQYTRVGPDARVEQLHNFSKRLLSERTISKELDNLNIKLSEGIIELPGRILHKESVLIGENKLVGFDSNEGFIKIIRRSPLHMIPHITNWMIIIPREYNRAAKEFIFSLQKAAAGMQICLPPPSLVEELNDQRTMSYITKLEQIISLRNPQLIMCVLKTARIDTYSAIKKKCCVDKAVPSQVVLKKIVVENRLSICTNVVIQMCCKVGGTPWSVNIPLQNTMYAGFDVYHETRSGKNSFGALVASVDKSLGRYFSSAVPHAPSQELSTHLCSEFAKALEAYKLRNGKLPENIVFYRDGVGDGQLRHVQTIEIDLLKDKLREVYHGHPPKLLFITVNKRIKTRLFFQFGNAGYGKHKNPPPGTVVDDVITLPNSYDFFLVSQSVRQGTVTPTYYIVLEDTLGLTPDQVQRLTYKLTYMYFNYPGPIRVPAPAQFAHKLAYLCGNFLRRPATEDWSNRLFYL